MTWQAAVVAVGEGMTATGSSVWLLGFFQRRLDHAGPLARGMGRAAFGAYVVQAPVAVAIARLAHPLPVLRSSSSWSLRRRRWPVHSGWLGCSPASPASKRSSDR